MKRILSVLLVCLLLGGLVACGSGEKSTSLSKPADILPRLEKAYNDKDYYAIAQCFEPSVSQAAEGLADLLGGAMGLSGITKLMPFASKLMGAFMDNDTFGTVTLTEVNTTNTGPLTAKLTYKVHIVYPNGQMKDIAETSDCVLVDGVWYFAAVQGGTPQTTQAPDPGDFVQKDEMRAYGGGMMKEYPSKCGEFHDGMAFIGIPRPEKPDSFNYVYDWWAIDKAGVKQFKMSVEPTTRWDKGFAFQGGTVINAWGEYVVTSLEQDFGGIFRLLSGDEGYNAASSLEDGYVLVYKQGEDYQGIFFQFGVLNTKGEWVIPLNSDNPISRQVQESGKLPAYMEYIWMGEGIVAFPYVWMFFDIAKQQWSEPIDRWEIGNYDKRILTGCRFENGVARTMNKAIFPNGTIKYLDFVAASNPNRSNLSDTRPAITYYEGLVTSGDQIFYNLGGERVLDFEGKGFSQMGNYFENGYNWALIVNSNGTYYITIIDKNGEFQFEPFQQPFAKGLRGVFLSGGVLRLRDYEGFGRTILYDLTGKAFFSVTGHISDFVDGLAVVQDGYGGNAIRYYIDTAGKRIIG